jgi:ligand-binding sensor domain-containing protein
MKCILRFLTVLTFAGCCSVIYGQQPAYSMEVFGSREGLLYPKIYSLYQSGDRRLWVGTENGISSFNGYEFTNHQYTDQHEPIGRIRSISEDSLHNIWMGGDKGLYLLRNRTIRKLEILPGLHPSVEAIYTDINGNLWVGDLNGLFRFTRAETSDITSNKIKVKTAEHFAGIKRRIFCISEDRASNIYISSFDGIFRISGQDQKVSILWSNPDPANFVRSVTALSPDSIYWNRADDQPVSMINNKIYYSQSQEFIGTTVFKYRNLAYALTTSGIAKIGQVPEPILSFGNSTNNAVTALFDQEGNAWIGTWEGLLKFRKTFFKQQQLQHPTQKEYFSFTQLKNGELLFGSNRGLVFKKNKHQISLLSSVPPLFPKSEVKCLYEDESGGLWAGSGYEGISLYKNNVLRNWQKNGILRDNNCEAFYPADNGKIFACTENGVTLINPGLTDPMEAHYGYDQEFIRHPELNGCLKTSPGTYLFYGNRGLFKLHGNRLIHDSIGGLPFKEIYINRIIQDQKNKFWIATQNAGLLMCIYKDNNLVLLKQYNKENGASDIALSVVCDNNNNIWYGDYMSLSVLTNPGPDEYITVFNEKDGLLYSYYEKLKLEKELNGTIWGLTSMGAFSFHPDSIVTNRLEPAPVIESIVLTDKTLDEFEGQTIEFPYKNNSLRVNFTAISLSDPSKIRYAYRIKEIDTNWIYTNERNASYNLLPAGRYTFQLIACNNSNIWSGYPVEFKFIIRPPFWQTWLFRLGCAFLLALLIYLFFQRRVRAVKNKAAIRQQLTELEGKALRAQMNPHFIFNSLNAIQELIVTEKIDAAYQYLSNFSRLLRLVLNNSEKNLIPLTAELEMITLQLSLESLRFKNSFQYNIVLDESVDADMIRIPPLLLQPYVENAIWHGLRHKDGEKNLWIRVYETNKNLTIEIEDNGVGREKAEEINRQKLGSGRYDSRGSALSGQRINFINEQYPGAARISITDILTETLEPAGTKVIISLANDLS